MTSGFQRFIFQGCTWLSWPRLCFFWEKVPSERCKVKLSRCLSLSSYFFPYVFHFSGCVASRKDPKKKMVVSTQSNCIKSQVQLSALPTHQTKHHKQKTPTPPPKNRLITHHCHVQAAIPHLGLAGVFHLHFFSNPITTSNDVFDCLSWFGKFAKILRPWLHRRTHLW